MLKTLNLESKIDNIRLIFIKIKVIFIHNKFTNSNYKYCISYN